MLLNALIIHQSVRYVVCSDINLLNKVVEFYNELCKKGCLNSLAEFIFKN